MRDQYAGDISDFLKYALLRQLAGDGTRRLGVAWYYDPGHDGGPDGRHLEWQDDENWAAFDPELHRSLSALPERTLAVLEERDFWPAETLFHREPVPGSFGHRRKWLTNMQAALGAANLVFLDPDTGLGQPSRKHATLEELAALREEGRALVFITFPARKAHRPQLEDLHEALNSNLGECRPTTLTTSVSLANRNSPGRYHPRIRWFTVIDGDETLHRHLRDFADRLSQLPRVRAATHG